VARPAHLLGSRWQPTGRSVRARLGPGAAEGIESCLLYVPADQEGAVCARIADTSTSRSLSILDAQRSHTTRGGYQGLGYVPRVRTGDTATPFFEVCWNRKSRARLNRLDGRARSELPAPVKGRLLSSDSHANFPVSPAGCS